MAVDTWLHLEIFFGFVTIFFLMSVDSYNYNGTNAMMGAPEIACTEDGVAFTMETERPFQGQVYVKNEYNNPKCKVNFKGVNKPGATFHLTFNECGMRRQRMLNPRGMMYSVVMMVQFHDVFVTQGDRAYQIRCFYSEQQMNLTHSLDVSPLTTQIMEATFPSPTCTYSIRAKSMDGPAASLVKIGDPIMHVFSCNFALDTYKILIKDCYVDDGKNQRQRIIGSDGCSMDETIMQTPHYSMEKLEAFGESTAFKWPDESVVYFSCQISLCANDDHSCDDITPPKCNGKSRAKRSNKPSRTELEFDLEVKKLTVVENDVLRAKTTASQKLSHPSSPNDTNSASKNSSLFEDYLERVVFDLSSNGSSPVPTSTSGSSSTTQFHDSIFDLSSNGSRPVPTSTSGSSSMTQFHDSTEASLRGRLSNVEESNRLQEACFGFETVAAFCVLFTLFVVSLTMITCKLCLPCCSDGDHHSRSTATNHRRRSVSALRRARWIQQNTESYTPHDFYGTCCGGKSNIMIDEHDFDESIAAYQQPIYTPVSLSAKQLLFSKLNLEI